MTVFAIAALHAIPIILAWLIFNTKLSLWISAIIAVYVAFAVGNSAYAIADLIAIAITLKYCLNHLTEKSQEDLPTSHKPTDVQQKADESSLVMLYIGVVCAAVLVIVLAVGSKNASNGIQAQPTEMPRQQSLPMQRTPRSFPASDSNDTIRANALKVQIENCLHIVNERKMMVCIENAK